MLISRYKSIYIQTAQTINRTSKHIRYIYIYVVLVLSIGHWHFKTALISILQALKSYAIAIWRSRNRTQTISVLIPLGYKSILQYEESQCNVYKILQLILTFNSTWSFGFALSEIETIFEFNVKSRDSATLLPSIIMRLSVP